MLNQLFSNIIWGQKGNYLEVPTDCPQRDERMGWTGDTEFFVPTAAYNFDVQSFFRRHLVTLCEDSQYADGSFAVVAPDLGAGSGGTAWGDAGWICPYNMYRAYGDTNVIADHYAAMQRCGQFDAAHASNYVISSLPGDFGDWLNLGGGASSAVMDTAFYAYYAQAMSEMALAIGRTADAASYAALHSNIVAAFATFFNADGSFTDGSGQTGYALAFTLDLVPAALRTQVAQQFANSIAQFDNHLATGFIGTPRLLPALHAAGRDDLAYTVLLQQTYPSWLYQVTLGATTMWERWDGWTPGAGFQTIGMNSFNHYAFGSVGEYLYSVVGGIKPASPGYKTIRIQPVPGLGLTWANTSYNSTRRPDYDGLDQYGQHIQSGHGDSAKYDRADLCADYGCQRHHRRRGSCGQLAGGDLRRPFQWLRHLLRRLRPLCLVVTLPDPRQAEHNRGHDQPDRQRHRHVSAAVDRHNQRQPHCWPPTHQHER